MCNSGDLEINLIVGGITAIGVLLSVIPVWLGLCVLKRRAWARYSLIAYGAAAVAAVQMWPLMQKEPLIGWGALAVPVLLIWSELRRRGFTGSFRGCWRGLALLAVDIQLVAVYVLAEVGLGGGDGSAGLEIVSMTLPIGLLVALLLALWAVRRDKNELWAGINAVIVAVAPLLISVIGFARTVIDVVGTVPS